MKGSVAAAMRCPTAGCGRPSAEGPTPAAGEVAVQVVDSGDPRRIYCGGSCASKGIAHVELGNHHIDGEDTGGAPTKGTRLTRLDISYATVRKWAHENDIPCGLRGTPPRTVIDAYLAAHPYAARADAS